MTLVPKPHKLFDVGAGASVDFVRAKNGRMTIWDRVGGPFEYTSGASRPYAERALRFESGRLVDVTSEFCEKLLSSANPDFDSWTRVLVPEHIKKLQSSAKVGSDVDSQVQEIASALLARAEQRVLCHRHGEAPADLNLWPEASREGMKDDFAESVKEYDPEFVVWPEAKSK